MTEGFFSDPADDTEPGPGVRADSPHPVVHNVLALDQEHGQQTGLTQAAALTRLRELGVSDLAAVRAIEQAPQSGDGMTWVDGILVSYANGYGWAVTPANRRPDVHDHEEYRDGTVPGCPACFPPTPVLAASRRLTRLLSEIRDIAGTGHLDHAMVGARVRTLLYPAHIHEDDGAVEGCPGCFPPAEVIPPVAVTCDGDACRMHPGCARSPATGSRAAGP